MEEHFNQLGWAESLYPVRVYRSKIRSSTDGGGVYYEAVMRYPLGINDWTAAVMGHVARSWYCGWVPPIGQELTRETLGPTLIKNLRALQEATETLHKICEKASRIALTLNQKSTALKSQKLMGVQDREEIQDIGKSLADLEDLIDRLAKTHSPLRAFSQMSKVQLHHLKSDDLAEMGKETAQGYRHLNEGVQIFRDWIKYTLTLIKPVAIQSATITTLESHPKPSDKELSP
jgi:hypothetical protein